MKAIISVLFHLLLAFGVYNFDFFTRKEKNNSKYASIHACLKLETELPYLKLNCEELINEGSISNFSTISKYHKRLEEESIENKKRITEMQEMPSITIKGLIDNTKKVNYFF